MGDELIDEISASAVSIEENHEDQGELSLEALILLINAERLKQLESKTEKEFKELRERQNQVKELHDLLKSINTATKDDGSLDLTGKEELKNQIQKAKELGIEIKEGKTSFNREERERLVENIRMTVDDLNVQNDMQLQTISRLTNERYESYQMARSILKPLQEAKSTIARGIRGG